MLAAEWFDAGQRPHVRMTPDDSIIKAEGIKVD
jgi:hypothetical protein